MARKNTRAPANCIYSALKVPPHLTSRSFVNLILRQSEARDREADYQIYKTYPTGLLSPYRELLRFAPYYTGC